jgi:hypothetical protein
MAEYWHKEKHRTEGQNESRNINMNSLKKCWDNSHMETIHIWAGISTRMKKVSVITQKACAHSSAKYNAAQPVQKQTI